jgi:hypothetical protein
LDEKQTVAAGLNPADFRSFHNFEICHSQCPLPNDIFDLISQNLELSKQERMAPFQPNSREFKANQQVYELLLDLQKAIEGSVYLRGEIRDALEEKIIQILRDLLVIWESGIGFFHVQFAIGLLWQVRIYAGVYKYFQWIPYFEKANKVFLEQKFPYRFWLHTLLQFFSAPINVNFIEYFYHENEPIILRWFRTNVKETTIEDFAFEFGQDIDALLESVFVKGTYLQYLLDKTLHEDMYPFFSQGWSHLTQGLSFPILFYILRRVANDPSIAFAFDAFGAWMIDRIYAREENLSPATIHEYETIIWKTFDAIFEAEAGDPKEDEKFPERTFVQRAEDPAQRLLLSREEIARQLRRWTLAVFRKSFRWARLVKKMTNPAAAVSAPAAAAAAANTNRNGGSCLRLSFLF